jgi:hypothetical protein
MIIFYFKIHSEVACSAITNSIGYFIESIHQVHNFIESSSFVYCHREANGMGHSLC